MGEGGATDADSFLNVLLRHACLAHCNPSSLRQRLVHASDHHQTHEDEMELAKAVCVRGCLMAERELLKGRARSTLPDEGMHAAVVDTAKIALLKASAIDLLHRVRDACAEQCTTECKQRGVPREAKHFQGYDISICQTDCARGCARYVDVLKDSF